MDCDVIINSKDEAEYIMGFKLDVDGLVIDSAGHCIDGQGKARIIDKNTFKSDVAHKRSTIHNRWGEIQHGL